MVNATQRKEQVEKLVGEWSDKLVKEMDAELAPPLTSDRLTKTNKDGKMLMCNFTLNPRDGGPDPLCFTINDEIKWIKRGQNVVIPWYFVEHMKLNIERKFRKEKDQQTGRVSVIPVDQLTESFQYQPIDPAPGVTI